MKKGVIVFGILLIGLFVFVEGVSAASQIVNEDFEGVTPGCIPRHDPTGSGEISECARTFYDNCDSCSDGVGSGCDAGKHGAFLATGGNPGQCARADVGPAVGGDSYVEPKWRLDNTIGGGKTIYIKFDLRQDANLAGEYTDLKLIRITDWTDASAASSSYWHPQLQMPPSSSGYSWYTWSRGGCYGEYYFSRATTKIANHLGDQQWHTYEVYVDIGSHVATSRDDSNCDGIVRLWEDGNLILEDTHAPMRCSSGEGQALNSAAFVRHIFGLTDQGYLYFDNIEVWDGMPDENTTDTTPPVRSNGQPTGTLASGTTQTTSSLTTDEAATCRYSTTLGTTYSSMTNIFTTTGSTAHSRTITGLTDGNSYNYYVKCIDGAGNVNTDDYAISFSVATPTSSCGDADTNQNSVVEIGELINYISQWKSGSVTIGNLITAIGEWKNGC